MRALTMDEVLFVSGGDTSGNGDAPGTPEWWKRFLDFIDKADGKDDGKFFGIGGGSTGVAVGATYQKEITKTETIIVYPPVQQGNGTIAGDKDGKVITTPVPIQTTTTTTETTKVEGYIELKEPDQ